MENRADLYPIPGPGAIAYIPHGEIGDPSGGRVTPSHSRKKQKGPAMHTIPAMPAMPTVPYLPYMPDTPAVLVTFVTLLLLLLPRADRMMPGMPYIPIYCFPCPCWRAW